MAKDLFDLTGKTALVTGARTGIGFAIAHALAEHGADIVTISSRIEPDSEIEQAIKKLGRNFKSIKCDFKSRAETVAVCKEIEKLDIEILVNNSGIANRGPVLEHTDEQWDETLEVDLTAPFLIARTVAQKMAKKGYGKIIFIASMWSFLGGANVISYTASKSAISGLTRGMSNELLPLGITVNAIAPGFIDTNINAAVRQNPTRFAYLTSRIPAGRWGVPEDLAGAGVFLAAPASDYVSGVVLAVDGGFLAN